MLAEMRAITDRVEATGKWGGGDYDRFNGLEDELRSVNAELEREHEAELREIRTARNGGTGGPGWRLANDQRRLTPMFDAFRAAGFDPDRHQAGELSFAEWRSVTWTGSLDVLHPTQTEAPPLGYDQRYAYPAFTQVGIDRVTTAVQILRQSARTLATTATVIRAVNAVTAKPETSSTLELATVPTNQLATIETNVPNVLANNPAAASVIENDLKMAISDAVDALLNTAFAASGFQAPGTDPLLNSIRKAMSTIMNSGYNPDTVVLTPAAAEALDILQTVGTEKFYVFAAAGLAPTTLFGMQSRISKTVAAPVVVDAKAFGKLYASPVELASFEADSGTTNRQNIRMEIAAAAFGTERQAAAVRIAAS
jgi:hypothetical protein